MERNSYMTTQEIAELLGIAVISAQRMAQRGELPARKIGNRYRFNAGEVEKWLKAKAGERTKGESRQVLDALEKIDSKLDTISKQLQKLQGGRK